MTARLDGTPDFGSKNREASPLVKAYGEAGEGTSMKITYSIHATRAGRTVIAESAGEVLGVFLGEDAEHELRAEFPLARQTSPTAFSRRVVAAIDAGENSPPLRFTGTPFQRRVWAAIMQIPRGQVMSYKDLALRAEATLAWRAVAGACASNKIAVLVPCHRVVPSRGMPGAYRWGADTKALLLEQEGMIFKSASSES